MKKIDFITDEGEAVTLYPEEQTVIGGMTYLLVSDAQEGEANAYILKEVSTTDEGEALYEMVEDETELDAVFRVFEQMLDDEEIDVIR